MCVSSGHHMCILCVLLYGITSGIPELHGAEAISEHSHDDKNHTELYLMEKDYFLKKLMKKYGNGEEMSYEGFEHLLHHLGLGGVIKFDHEVSCHKSKNSSEFLQIHLHHNHSAGIKSTSTVCGQEDEHLHNDHDHDSNDHIHDEHVHGADDHDHDHSHNGHEGEHIHEDHEHTEDQDHDHEHSEDDDHENTGKHDHEHTDDHNHDHEHTGDNDHGHEHTEDNDHGHEHTGEHDHEHTDDHNHDHEHTADHEHEHTEENDHDHEHTEENDHDHEHTGEHDHNEESEKQDHEHNSQKDNVTTGTELDNIHSDHKHVDHGHGEADHKHEHDNHDHGQEDDKHNDDDHQHDHDDHDHLPLEKQNSDNNNRTVSDNIVNEHTDHEHNETQSHSHDHNDHIEESKKNDHEHDHDHDHDHDHHVHKREAGDNECLPPNVMLHLVHLDKPRSLTQDMFKELCPSLIYQIDADSCHSSHSEPVDYHGDHDGHHGDHDGYKGIHHHDHDGHDHSDHEHDHSTHAESANIDLSKVPARVWGYSAIAVIIISLVGLLGVAVIPIMQKVFYNHMLQFLVALAVGALSGDALLHLFPHAIAGQAHENDGHDHGSGGHSHDTGPIYKGLCGLLGIYFFFFTERILTIFTEYKRKKKQTKNRNKFTKDKELVKVGEKLANSECDGMMMSIHPNKALRGYADEAHSEHCTISFEDTTTVSHEHGQCPQNHEETCVDGDENTSMMGSNNSLPKSHGHGHVHGHGHGHSHGVDGVPDSVASVAWMVILGDGIHNFSDGLAIGAAFVNSITGGFSTSIAVFCHELPHEIGDFAMLLRAGMSPKQAIIYNCLSSILCFVGMLIGVAVGNLTGATLWIFAMVGGMFLYIALVDMLPELTSVETKKGEHPLCHLLLQGIGMCVGAGIMLAIALYEEDLRTMLD